MSQITSQLGDSLINGLLAGMKYQNFKEDLKMSRLQRAEYEVTTGYRQSLAAINAQKAQSELIRSQLGEEADRVTAQFAQPMAEAGLAGTQARTKGTQAETAQTEQSTKFAALLQPSRQIAADADASRAQSEAGSAKLGMLSQALGVGASQGRARGMSGLMFTPADATALATAQVESLGIKDESAKGVMRSQLLQGILGGVEQGKQEIATTQAKLSEAKMDDYLKQVGLAAHVASYGPAGVTGAQQLLGQDHPITKAASMMIAGVPQAVAKPVPESAWTKEDAKALNQEIRDLYKKRREMEVVARTEKAGTPGKLWGRNVDEVAVRTAQENLADVESDIKDLETRKAQMENPQGIQNSTKFMDKQAKLEYPPEIVAFAKANKLQLKPNPTQAEIDEAIAYVKSQSRKKG